MTAKMFAINCDRALFIHRTGILAFALSLSLLPLRASAQTAVPTASPAAIAANPPITQGQRVFACTHSFYPYAPGMVRELAASAGITGHQVIGISLIGGSMIIQHWNVPDDRNKAKAALIAGQVDVLTLAALVLPDDGIEKFTQLGLDHNPAIRVLVEESWLPADSEDSAHFFVPPKIPLPAKVDRNLATVDSLEKLDHPYIQEMEAFITGLNQKFGRQVLYVVPCCQAVTLLREKIMEGKAPGITDQNILFLDPIGHPGPVIMALASYCHYAVIYRRSPVGLPMPADSLRATGKSPNLLDSAVNPDAAKLNTLLQELAWQAVTGDPLAGVSK
ncbi:MAG: hypothetical protein WCD79_21215 [Chthoniobacteraceae bacterium]